MALFLTSLILVSTIIASVLMHFEALQFLGRYPLEGRVGLVGAVLVLLVVHLLEVGLFGTAFYGATRWMKIGTFAGEHSMTAIDYYYYAAETYSSLGYGDIYPVGEIRLLASVTPIVGILLLGWSSTFLYSNLKLPVPVAKREREVWVEREDDGTSPPMVSSPSSLGEVPARREAVLQGMGCVPRAR